jgi:hypothetical protein
MRRGIKSGDLNEREEWTRRSFQTSPLSVEALDLCGRREGIFFPFDMFYDLPSPL